MLRYAKLSLIVGVAAMVSVAMPADAAKKKPLRKTAEATESKQQRASVAYRSGPQVRGFVQRRGGYSYAASDSINTYGDSQSRYSGYSLFRNNDFGRQSSGGPFDSDFFFDSGLSPRGGNSPYQN